MLRLFIALIAALGFCFVGVGCNGDDFDVDVDESEIVQPGDAERSGRIPGTGSLPPDPGGDDTP